MPTALRPQPQRMTRGGAEREEVGEVVGRWGEGRSGRREGDEGKIETRSQRVTRRCRCRCRCRVTRISPAALHRRRRHSSTGACCCRCCCCSSPATIFTRLTFTSDTGRSTPVEVTGVEHDLGGRRRHHITPHTTPSSSPHSPSAHTLRLHPVRSPRTSQSQSSNLQHPSPSPLPSCILTLGRRLHVLSCSAPHQSLPPSSAAVGHSSVTMSASSPQQCRPTSTSSSSSTSARRHRQQPQHRR